LERLIGGYAVILYECITLALHKLYAAKREAKEEGKERARRADRRRMEHPIFSPSHAPLYQAPTIFIDLQPSSPTQGGRGGGREGVAAACGRTKIDLPVFQQEQIEPAAGLLGLERLQEARGDKGGSGRGGVAATAALHHRVPVCAVWWEEKRHERGHVGRRRKQGIGVAHQSIIASGFECGVFPPSTPHTHTHTIGKQLVSTVTS